MQLKFGRVACDALLAVSLLMVTHILRAEDKALDDQLLDNLNNELLDGLETLPVDEPADGDAAKPSADDSAAGDEDTFAKIAKRMREAEQLIPKEKAAKNARQVQKEIVTDLDKLIAQLEQQCQKCMGKSSASKPSDQQGSKRESVKQPSQSLDGEQNANGPARDSTTKLGKDEVRKPDMAEMKGLLKDLWGQLPEKAREQMLQSSPEQFLPKYELLIEQYYKRLAEKDGK